MMEFINISLESYNYINYSMEKDIYEEIRDPEFAEHFLGRLVADCKYILGACMDYYDKGYFTPRKAALTHLWAQDDVDEQISLMRACKKTLDKAKIKSRISDEDIDKYEAKLKKIESLKEASTLSYKTKDGEVLNFYNDENFPVSLNEIPYKNDFDLYKRVYLSIALRYFKVCDIHEYNDLKNNALRVLMHFYRFRDLIDQIEEMLEGMYEELEYAEYQAKNGGIYYTKRDYDIIKICVDEMEDLLVSVKKHSKLNENKSHLL